MGVRVYINTIVPPAGIPWYHIPVMTVRNQQQALDLAPGRGQGGLEALNVGGFTIPWDPMGS